MRRGTISISIELKRRLDALRGERTWDEFLTELLDAVIEARARRVESYLRETADRRDIPLERLELKLRDGSEAYTY